MSQRAVEEKSSAVFCVTMPEKWELYCPSALEPEDMLLWSCGTTTFDFTAVEDVYAKDDKVLENMW